MPLTVLAQHLHTVRHKHGMPLVGIVDITVAVAASDAQAILETSPIAP